MRAPGERPFAVSLAIVSESLDCSRDMIKTVFKAAHVLVTTVARVHIKMIFTAIAYNLYQLRALRKAGVI
jgi:hypothetical protein